MSKGGSRGYCGLKKMKMSDGSLLQTLLKRGKIKLKPFVSTAESTLVHFTTKFKKKRECTGECFVVCIRLAILPGEA
jgi:hypothetical protein